MTTEKPDGWCAYVHGSFMQEVVNYDKSVFCVRIYPTREMAAARFGRTATQVELETNWTIRPIKIVPLDEEIK